MRRFVVPLSLALSVAAIGCGNDAISQPQPDMTVLPDLAQSPPDLVIVASGVGEPCSGAAFQQDDCIGGNEICIPPMYVPGGYCTQQCSANNPCPSDAKCLTVMGQQLCFKSCLKDADCRAAEGYACSNSKVCFPSGGGGNGGGVTPGTKNGAACVTPVIAPGQGLAGPFGKNLQVSPGNGPLDAETELMADPTGTNVLVSYIHVANGGASSIGAEWSHDGGKSFSQNVLIPPDMTVDKNSTASDPVVAMDSMGTIFVTWVGYDFDQQNNPINMTMWVAASKNGGLTFDQVSQVTPAGEWVAGGFLDKPWIAISPVDDSVWVTWDRATSQNAPVQVRMARSADHGKTWAAPIELSDSGARPNLDRNLCQITVGDSGKPVAVWVEIGQQQFGATDNGVFLQRLNSDGTKSGVNVQVSAGADSPAFEDPSVAAIGSNVYVGFVSGTSKGDWDVRVAASLDGGKTFAPSVKANDDATCATHFHHQIAVDPKGNLHAIWYDNRFLTGNVFYASSGPADAMNALKFGKNTFVNDAPFTFTTRRDQSNWLGDYLGLVANASGLFASWSDNRGTNKSRIFFARGVIP